LSIISNLIVLEVYSLPCLKKKKKKKKSPILFNLFVNDILNNCEKYGVSIGRKKCCGGLFADDVVFIAPSAKNLEKLLKKVH